MILNIIFNIILNLILNISLAFNSLENYPKQAKKLEQVADYRGINIERIIALQPDLVVAWQGGNPEKALKKTRDPLNALKPF